MEPLSTPYTCTPKIRIPEMKNANKMATTTIKVVIVLSIFFLLSFNLFPAFHPLIKGASIHTGGISMQYKKYPCRHLPLYRVPGLSSIIFLWFWLSFSVFFPDDIIFFIEN